MRTTILYTAHNNYPIFRASVESLLAHVPREHYAKLLIVDDCSSDKMLLSFLDRLASDYDFVEVVHIGEPADLSYYNSAGAGGVRIYNADDALQDNRAAGVLGDQTTSKGHGGSVNFGLEHVETEFVLVVDPDILFMKKSMDMIPAVEACMDMDPTIMSVGQLPNRIDGIRVFDWPFRIPMTDTDKRLARLKRRIQRGVSESDAMRIVQKMWRINAGRSADPVGVRVKKLESWPQVNDRTGWPIVIACLMRMSGWTEHKLPLFKNGGWISGDYALALFRQGLKTCNFNVFRDEYLIHLGYGTLLDTHDAAMATKGFYFSRHDSSGWGPSVGRGWWYGYCGIPYTTKQFRQILDNAYAKLNFSTRMNIVTFECEI